MAWDHFTFAKYILSSDSQAAGLSISTSYLHFLLMIYLRTSRYLDTYVIIYQKYGQDKHRCV